jgi:hypothetical protein
MAHDRLEPLADGFVAFHTEKGERWKHRDVAASRTGPGYRLFVSDRGEQRQYAFGPTEPHDATLLDLREQLARATPVDASSVTGAAGGGERAAGRERLADGDRFA